MKNRPRPARRRRQAVGLLTCLLLFSEAVPGICQEAPRAGGDRYLDQLRTERRENWLARDLRELKTFPHLDRAYRLLREGRPGEAREELELALAADPNDLGVRYTLVVVLDRLGEHDEVARQSSLLLEARPSFVPALLYRGLARQALAEADLAAEDFRRVAQSDAEPEDRIFALGMVADLALARQDWEGALAALKGIEDLGSDDFDRRFRVGLALDGMARHSEAVAAFGRALDSAKDPDQMLAVSRARGHASAAAGDWETAWMSWLKAAEIAPDDLELQRSLARAALAKGDLEEGVLRLRAVLDAGATAADREALADGLFRLSRFAEAADQFALLERQVPAGEERYRHALQLGYTLERLRRYRDAAAAFRRAAEIRADAKALRGWVRGLQGIGHWEEAARIAERVLAADPGPRTSLWVGGVWARAGEVERAIRQLEVAGTGAGPAEVRTAAWRGIGYLEAGRGRHAAALDAFGRALEARGGGEAEILFAAAESALHLGETEEAIALLKRGLAREDRADVRKALAQALADTGRVEEALETYRLLYGDGEVAGDGDLLRRIAQLELERGNPGLAGDLFLRSHEVVSMPDPSLLARAAESYLQAERWQEVLEANRRLLDVEGLAPPLRGEALARQGHLQAAQGELEAAAGAFAEALATGDETPALRSSLGLTLTRLGRWSEALEQFRRAFALEGSVTSRLHLARCYAALELPGTALNHLKQVAADMEGLEAADRELVLEELAQLSFEQASYREAAAAWERRLEISDDPVVLLRLAVARRRSAEDEEARNLLARLDPATLPSNALRAVRLDELAALAMAGGGTEDAVELLRRAHELEPSAERLYRLGLALQRLGRVEEAVGALVRAVDDDPDTLRYREAAGYAYLAAGELEAAVGAFEAVVAHDPDYLALVPELGYLNMRLARNRTASDWFRRAIEEAPLHVTHSEQQAEDLRIDIDKHRQEVRRLENRVDATLYLSSRNEELPRTGGVPVVGGGALPSQVGLELALQPPRLGLRDGRIFHVFGRVFGNLQQDSLDPDSESLQGGLGVRYKPLRRQNLFLSAERLIRIGDASQDNWLLRGLYSWQSGSVPGRGRRLRNYSFGFLDAAYLVEDPATWSYFAEVRQGFTLELGRRLRISPHLMADGRYQDPGSGTSSWVEGGGGFSIKLVRRVHEGWAGNAGLELLLHYRRGRFIDLEGEPRDDTFDGFVATAVVGF